MRFLVVLALIVISFSAGAIMGWDSGVRDAGNLYSATTEGE